MSVATPNKQIVQVPAAAISSGDVLKATAFSGAAALPGDTNGFINRVFALPSFTPRSAASKIVIEVDADYQVDLYNSDEWQAILKDSTGATVMEKRQRWNGLGGGGTRSSVMLPMLAVYDNTSIAAKTFTLEINRIAGDDTCKLYNFRTVRFTEIKS